MYVSNREFIEALREMTAVFDSCDPMRDIEYVPLFDLRTYFPKIKRKQRLQS